MNALNKLAIFSVAAVTLAAAVPAQADDHRRHNGRNFGHYGHYGRGHSHGYYYRNAPRYYSYSRPYYYNRPYYYSRPRVIYSDPYAYDGYYGPSYYSSPRVGLSFAFGGGRWHGYHHHHHH